MKINIEIDGAAANAGGAIETAPGGAQPATALAPPAHIAARAAATGALNAGPAPSLPQSPATAYAPATHHVAAAARAVSTDISAGTGPASPADQPIAVIDESTG